MTTRAGHTRPVCDWASCDRLDIGPVDHEGKTWQLCPPHRREHFAIYEPKVVRKRAVAKCGTPSGYNRHSYDKTPACRPCLDSVNDARKKRKAA